MELQTEEFPGWDRSPVAFMRTSVVSQFAAIATTVNLFETNEYMYIDDEDDDDAVAAAVAAAVADDDDDDDYNVHCECHLLFILPCSGLVCMYLSSYVNFLIVSVNFCILIPYDSAV